MKNPSLLAFVFAGFAFCSTSQANITNMVWNPGNAGGAVWSYYHLYDNIVTLHGAEHTTSGSMACQLFADSPLDPTLTLNNTLDNDSAFSWTGFHVEVTMDRIFTLSAAAVNVPGNWSATISQQPSLVGGLYSG